MAVAPARIAQAVRDDGSRTVRLRVNAETTGQYCALTPADIGLGRPH
ncbi:MULTISPECIES: hypothetical protein [Streptomyces]|uniref:Uncharacterized protein n=2 Tax=Streptomyces TaxID=1883 RepID=A0ABV9J1H7_9ACTN